MEYLIILLVTALFFERAMYCGYVVDDDVCYRRMKTLKESKNKHWPHFLKMACYGAGIFKNATQEHLATIILHGINCLLIYQMSKSLPAALLYCINPINNQTTLWLNGRRYALTVLAVLLAWNFWPVALPCLAFAAWVHTSGIPAPMLWLFTPYWPLSIISACLAVIFGIDQHKNYFIGRKNDFRQGNQNQDINPKKIILFIKTIGYQFFNCIFPMRPAMYHNFLFYFSGTEQGTKEGYSINFDFWKGLAVCGLLGYLVIWHHSFYAFWFVLFISIWCNLYQVTMNASDRYCSLANVGLMCLVAEWTMKLPDPYRYAVFTGLAVLYTIKYMPLFHAYKNVENFHQYHITVDQSLVNPRFFLSKYYLAKKDPYQAFSVIKQGLRYRPYDFKLLLSFIECLFSLGKRKQALAVMDFVEEKNCIQLGEHEDTKNLFEGIRKEYKKEYELLHGKVNGKVYVHNNGKPVIKKASNN